jgi:hypothetical protein
MAAAPKMRRESTAVDWRFNVGLWEAKRVLGILFETSDARVPIEAPFFVLGMAWAAGAGSLVPTLASDAASQRSRLCARKGQDSASAGREGNVYRAW